MTKSNPKTNYKNNTKNKKLFNQPEDLTSLQQKWYKKLAKEGFNDIELSRTKSNKLQLSPLLMGNKLKEYRYHTFNEKLDHYRLCSNFVQHFKFNHEAEQFIFSAYAEGASYDSIVRLFRSKYGARTKAFLERSWWRSDGRDICKITKKAVFLFLKSYIPVCYKWNRENPEGIILGESEPFVDEVMINEPETEFADQCQFCCDCGYPDARCNIFELGVAWFTAFLCRICQNRHPLRNT